MASIQFWTPAQEQRLIERLELHRLSGSNGSHSREDNLAACEGLAAGEPHYTFGIHSCAEAVATDPSLTPECLLHMIAAITGCSKNPHEREGRGYINTRATLRGLYRVARTIARLAPQGKSFFFGTGHPGCMLSYYQTLAALVRDLGGTIITEGANEPVKEGGFYIDYLSGVAVMTDEGGLPHTHESEPSMIVFDLCRRNGLGVDCAMVDHGWAAGPLNHGVYSLVIMDTNDPVVALAKKLGAPIDIVPLNDNRPNGIIKEAADIVVATTHAILCASDLDQPLDNVA